MRTGEAAAQATEAAAGPSADAAAAAAAAPAAEEEGDSIDPEFLAALPPEIQAEVLEQQRRERRMRERQRQQQQAAAAAAQVSISPCTQRHVLHKLLCCTTNRSCLCAWYLCLARSRPNQLEQMTYSYSIRGRGHPTHSVYSRHACSS